MGEGVDPVADELRETTCEERYMELPEGDQVAANHGGREDDDDST